MLSKLKFKKTSDNSFDVKNEVVSLGRIEWHWFYDEYVYVPTINIFLPIDTQKQITDFCEQKVTDQTGKQPTQAEFEKAKDFIEYLNYNIQGD